MYYSVNWHHTGYTLASHWIYTGITLDTQSSCMSFSALASHWIHTGNRLDTHWIYTGTGITLDIHWHHTGHTIIISIMHVFQCTGITLDTHWQQTGYTLDLHWHQNAKLLPVMPVYCQIVWQQPPNTLALSLILPKPAHCQCITSVSPDFFYRQVIVSVLPVCCQNCCQRF